MYVVTYSTCVHTYIHTHVTSTNVCVCVCVRVHVCMWAFSKGGEGPAVVLSEWGGSLGVLVSGYGLHPSPCLLCDLLCLLGLTYVCLSCDCHVTCVIMLQM